MLGPKVLHLSLSEVGVVLGLVERRHHGGAVQERREVFDRELLTPILVSKKTSDRSSSERSTASPTSRSLP